MTEYSWDFVTVFANFDVLLRGLRGTFQLVVLALGFGLGLGLVIGAARFSKWPPLNWPATAFIELFRNTPVLVQLMWFFYAFPILIGVQLSAFTAATVALSLNTGAFCAEIFRGGIQSISRTQWEAGWALGMNYPSVMRRVLLPQAIKRMLPAFTNRAIELTKMTSLASTIAFAELLYEGKLLSSVLYRPIETYTTVAAIYCVMVLTGTLFVNRLEAVLRRSD